MSTTSFTLFRDEPAELALRSGFPPSRLGEELVARIKRVRPGDLPARTRLAHRGARPKRIVYVTFDPVGREAFSSALAELSIACGRRVSMSDVARAVFGR